jgi:hypothetical protein
MTVVEFYNQSVKQMPAAERLRLAALILNDIAPDMVQSNDEWSEEDLADFTRAGWVQIDARAGESEDA